MTQSRLHNRSVLQDISDCFIPRHRPPWWRIEPAKLSCTSLLRGMIAFENCGTIGISLPPSPMQHVRGCFEAAMPALSALTEAFPEDIPPEHVSEEAFLWASQLWYSYGMEVGVNQPRA